MILSTWLASLFLVACGGWLAGGRYQISSGPKRSRNLHWLRELPAQGVTCVRACSEQPDPPGDPDGLKQRGHIFDNMPPLDAVRAQVQSIRDQERVWEAPDVLESLLAAHFHSAFPNSDARQGEGSTAGIRCYLTEKQTLFAKRNVPERRDSISLNWPDQRSSSSTLV